MKLLYLALVLLTKGAQAILVRPHRFYENLNPRICERSIIHHMVFMFLGNLLIQLNKNDFLVLTAFNCTCSKVNHVELVERSCEKSYVHRRPGSPVSPNFTITIL